MLDLLHELGDVDVGPVRPLAVVVHVDTAEQHRAAISDRDYT